MKIEEALGYAARGEAILFLGAGFSLGAKNVKNFDFKSGRALNELFCSRAGLPEGTPMEDASEAFAKKFGTDELIDILRKEYTVKSIEEYHKTIACLPWHRIYTTNYDNVFETAATQANRMVVPISPNANIHLTPKQNPLCIHLNGYINDLDRSTIWSSFKLTDTSYSSASIENSEWATLLRQDIKYARAVFFIGYSLYDLDIKRILRDQESLKEKTFFVLYDGVDAVTEMRANRYGYVSKLGSENLAKKIIEGDYHIPQTSDEISVGRSLIEIQAVKPKRKTTDKEFIDLLMIGEFSPALTQVESNDKSLYYCERTILQEIAKKIDSGETSAVLIHGNIANGKSIAVFLLSELLLSMNWRVFHAVEISEYTEEELHAIAGLSEKVVLVIDDYVDWLNNLKGLTNLIGDRFRVVVTARSNTHDIFEEELIDALSPLQIAEFNLNTLTKQEIDWWVNIFDTYGLWGEQAGYSQDRKSHFITDHCNREIHGILLKLLESPNIKKRLSDAAAEIKAEPMVEKICIAIFVLTILNQNPTIEIITDIWGVNILDKPHIKNNQGLLNFVDLSRSSIRVRSSVASEYLLKNFWDAEKIVKVMLEIANVSNRLYKMSFKYESLFKTLVRFGNIQNALPEKGKREGVIKYFEELKLIDRNKHFPLFWLQYAIGALVIDDLERAELYFNTSYSLAEKKGWDTYQIDNHYARFLLVKAAEVAGFQEAIKHFRNARTLVNRQIQTDKMHYPFRVALSYQPFYDRFESKFSSDLLRELFEAANTVLKRINELPSERSDNRYVKQCKTVMEYIMERTKSRLQNINYK